jgi:hypothetical protein
LQGESYLICQRTAPLLGVIARAINLYVIAGLYYFGHCEHRYFCHCEAAPFLSVIARHAVPKPNFPGRSTGNLNRLMCNHHLADNRAILADKVNPGRN